ncbi:MAG: hypothetical protein PHF36_05840 [Candidatus Cloacimonetes bacterium]|nr:hypothetical protein [Candidatus Cloacimonadota bacterium]
MNKKKEKPPVEAISNRQEYSLDEIKNDLMTDYENLKKQRASLTKSIAKVEGAIIMINKLQEGGK